MTDNNYTAFAAVLDRSGSMGDIKVEAENAINAFVEDQKKLPGKATLTLTQFDNKYDILFTNRPLDQVGRIELAPRGMTALYDATARTIINFGESLAAMPEDQRPGKVLFIIITDGFENASIEWTQERLSELIKSQREQWNWEFIYLAASETAILDAEKISIPAMQTQSWQPTPRGVGIMGQSVSAYASSYRSTGKGDWEDKK